MCHIIGFPFLLLPDKTGLNLDIFPLPDFDARGVYDKHYFLIISRK